MSTADRSTCPADLSTAWHTRTAADAAERLGSDLQNGLSSEEAARRLAQFGPNEIHEQPPRSLFAMAIAQFKDFMVLVLIAAAIVSGLIGDAEDTLVILGIVVLNAAVGFVQDFRAERAMAALKRLAALKAAVLRDGRLHTIPATEIVPGDIVVVEAGNAVPADLRLIEAPRAQDHRGGADRRSRTGGKAGGTTRGSDAGGRRSSQYGVQGHHRYLRPRARHCRRDRHGDRTRQDRRLVEEHRRQAKRRCSVALLSFGRQLAVAILAICAVVFGFGICCAASRRC